MTYSHRPVLLDEAVTALLGETTLENAMYLDGTFGRGGHSRLILERIANTSQLWAIDKDPQAILEAKNIIDSRFRIAHTSFSKMSDVVLPKSLDGI